MRCCLRCCWCRSRYLTTLACTPASAFLFLPCAGRRANRRRTLLAPLLFLIIAAPTVWQSPPPRPSRAPLPRASPHPYILAHTDTDASTQAHVAHRHSTPIDACMEHNHEARQPLIPCPPAFHRAAKQPACLCPPPSPASLEHCARIHSARAAARPTRGTSGSSGCTHTLPTEKPGRSLERRAHMAHMQLTNVIPAKLRQRC